MQPAGNQPPSSQEFLEFGRWYEAKYGPTQYSAWHKQFANAKKGDVVQENYCGYTHILHALYFYHTQMQPSSSVSLQNRIEEINKKQERTLQEIFSGSSPEMNALVEAAVLRKFEELNITPQQQVEDQQRAQDMRSVLQITQEAIAEIASLQDRDAKIARLITVVDQIQAIIRGQQAQTDEEEALQRLVSLISALSP